MRPWRSPIARTAAFAVLSCLLTAGVLVAVTRAVRPPAQDRLAAPGTAWLSGEVRGRAVLAAPGSQAGSVAVALGDPGVYDVTSLATQTAVFDRMTGALVLLDPALGTIKERRPRLATRGTGFLVAAGTAAYIVDADAGAVRRVAPDGRVGDKVELGAFSAAVGTSDGQLWMIDAPTGSATVFDSNGSPHTTQVIDPGADVVLTALGPDPVLLDRGRRTLRWLTRSTSLALEPGGAVPVLQQPDVSGYGDCVTVVDDARVVCYQPKGALRSATIVGPVGDAQVFSGPSGVVLATPGSPEVSAGAWGTELAPVVRTDPSSRPLTSRTTPSAVLVDDPGSRYALTMTAGKVTTLDKFSRRTVIITPDGPKIDLDADTQLVTKVPVRRPAAGAPTKPTVDTKPGNDPPTPNDDHARTRSGRPVNIDVLANDTDPDGDTLVVVAVGEVTRGAVKSLNGSTVLYSPPDGFVGSVTFDYTAGDPGGLRATAHVTVDVVGADQNEAPVPADDSGETVSGVPVTIPVLANDADPEGDPLSIVAVGTPGDGTAAVTADGELRYEPKLGFVGADEFAYTVADGHGGQASARVSVTVDPTGGKNRPPVAVDDRGTVVAGKRIRVAVTQNDTDPDGDSIHIVSTGNVFGMTASIVGGQSIDIVPDLRTAGVVAVPYTIEDSGGLRSSAQVILVVEVPTPNRAPQAIDDNVVVASEVKVIDVVANDVDPDGDALTIVGFTKPAVGGVVSKGSATTLRFVPTQGFTSRTSFEYTVSDPDGLTSTAKVNIEVVPPTGSGPVAVDDAATIYVNETARVDVISNDSQPDGVPFTLAGPPTVRAGRAVVNADNSISFTPPAEAVGTFVLTYTIRDFYNRTASARMVVTVLGRPVGGTTAANNRPPLAVDDRAVTTFQAPVVIDVLANDTDPEGQVLGVATVAAGIGGSPSIVSVAPSTENDGNPGSRVQVRFEPSPGFSGIASFTYEAADTLGGKASAKVVVEVGQRLKVAPIGRDDLITMTPSTTLLVDPRVNDFDPDGSASTLRITGLVSVPAGLVVAIDPGGTSLRLTSGQPGNFSFGYQITDADGLTSVALITVTVAGSGNRPPVTANDAATTGAGVPVVVDVLLNDTDPDGSVISLTAVVQPATGGTTAIQNGAVLFTPTAGFTGTATFTYTIADAGGLKADGTVTVTVIACAVQPPVLADDAAVTSFNTARSVDLFANDTRTTGTLTFGRPTAGTVADGAGPGVVVYTPPPTFSGRATFTYTVTPSCGAPATATVTVTVTPANRPPVANNDLATTTRGTPVTIDVLANDTDPDPADTLGIVGSSAAVGGVVSPTGNALLFTPNPGFVGNGSFVYEITDSGGLRASALVSVTVNLPVNRRPTATNDGATTTPGVAVTIDVLANDTDPDGDPLSILSVGPASPPGSGSASIVPAGTVPRQQIVFTPSFFFFGGPSTFTYTISDGRGGTDTAAVTVTPATNRPPVAVDDPSATAVAGTVSLIDVLANDTDPDGDQLAIQTVGPVAPVGSGMAAAVNGKVSFTASVAGTSTFTYTITDPGGLTATATVTVTVAPAANRAPVANADSGVIAAPDTSVTVNALANDTDPDGDPLTIVVTPPPNPTPVPTPDDGVGTIEVLGNSIRFTILPTFATPGITIVTIPYTVSDGRGGTASENLTITVTM